MVGMETEMEEISNMIDRDRERERDKRQRHRERERERVWISSCICKRITLYGTCQDAKPVNNIFGRKKCKWNKMKFKSHMFIQIWLYRYTQMKWCKHAMIPCRLKWNIKHYYVSAIKLIVMRWYICTMVSRQAVFYQSKYRDSTGVCIQCEPVWEDSILLFSDEVF